MNLNQRFSYTGSSNFDFTNIPIADNGVSLFDSKSGIGGVDYMPADGDTVTIVAGLPTSGVDDTVMFEPSMNNKAYYLVSEIEYTSINRADIIALATEIPLYFSTDRYIGTFVFSNPNDYEYLYLIWDYTDNMDLGVVSYTGGSTNRVIDVDFGADLGRTGITYSTTVGTARYSLKWNGSVVGDTGYVGVNSMANYNELIAAGATDAEINLVFPYDGLVNNGAGSLYFKKYNTSSEGFLAVSSPTSSNSFSASLVTLFTAAFFIDSAEGTEDDVCFQVPDEAVYHNGSAALPVAGDSIYTAADGSVAFNGNNAYHLISTTSLVVPPVSGGVYVLVDTNGLVLSVFGCDCGQYAPPVITQPDIYLVSGKQTQMQMQAVGEPTVWEIDSSCSYYELTGASTGTLFTITNCDGVTENITVNINETVTVQSSATPVVLSGDGAYVIDVKYLGHLLPAGINFDLSTGILSGVADDCNTFPIRIRATNCFGTGVYADVNITVSTGIKLTPFAIDVDNFSDTGDGACVVSPTYSILYHDGPGRVPADGDTIYSDSLAAGKFMGGSVWYYIDHSTYSIKICENGKVCAINECPAITTTTTSTTTTTTTTTLPVGDYYTATLCSGDPTVFTLFDVTTTGVLVGDIIKTTDGNCWGIASTTTASYPYFEMENPVVVYADCATCLGITTTTTTTTTTTIPPLTLFAMDITDRATDYLACSNTIGATTNLYHNGVGTYPAVGDFVFTDLAGTTPFDGLSKWYFILAPGDYAIRISSTGLVLNITSCAGVTTTTTTTTLPTYYYEANVCGTVSPVVILKRTDGLTSTIGDVVKCDDGRCYTITNTSGVIVTTKIILFTYDDCLDCQGVTTTTTSTTTTTTTTSTTTTTTTTTLPPLTRLIVRYDDPAVVCNADLTEVYVDGPIGILGGKVYKKNGLSYSLIAAGYVMQTNSTTAHEWDGADWTGITSSCA